LPSGEGWIEEWWRGVFKCYIGRSSCYGTAYVQEARSMSMMGAPTNMDIVVAEVAIGGRCV
jgi:hypothetical protein